MHVVMRRYSGENAQKFGALMMEHKSELEALLRGVKGFNRWTAWKMEDGSVMTATICNDKAGCDNSIHVAREWVGKNAAHLGLQAPQISEGELVHQIMA